MKENTNHPVGEKFFSDRLIQKRCIEHTPLISKSLGVFISFEEYKSINSPFFYKINRRRIDVSFYSRRASFMELSECSIFFIFYFFFSSSDSERWETWRVGADEGPWHIEIRNFKTSNSSFSNKLEIRTLWILRRRRHCSLKPCCTLQRSYNVWEKRAFCTAFQRGMIHNAVCIRIHLQCFKMWNR